MVTELKVKNEENNKIFTLYFPQVNKNVEIPMKIMIDYEEDTRKCETFTSYGDLPAMEFNCTHKPTKHGWTQTYVNVNLSGENCESEKVNEPDSTTVVSEKVKNPIDDKEDLYTILDPEDKTRLLVLTDLLNGVITRKSKIKFPDGRSEMGN